MKIIYEIEQPYIKEDYKKQEKENPKYHFRSTCEIYNYKTGEYEIYFPYMLNLTKKNVDDRYVATSIFYDMKGFTSPLKELISPEIKEYYNTNFKKKNYNLRLPNYNINDFINDDREIIENNLKKIQNGIYYINRRNDYISNNKIKIRPIPETSVYKFNYKPSIIKNNYWVKKLSLIIKEEKI